jgi:hypothetical protein
MAALVLALGLGVVGCASDSGATAAGDSADTGAAELGGADTDELAEPVDAATGDAGTDEGAADDAPSGDAALVDTALEDADTSDGDGVSEEGDNTVCALTLAAGQFAACAVEVVRAAESVPAPVSLAFVATYPEAELRFVEAVFYPCGEPTCAPLSTPPSALPLGHTVALVPPDAASWDGLGSVSIAPGTSLEPLSTALASAEPGKAAVVWLRFQALAAIDAAPVALQSVSVSGGPAAALSAAVNARRVVVSGEATGLPAKCSQSADCADGLSCTTDVCTLDGTCANDPAAGFCAIAGACVQASAPNPSNDCEECKPEANGTGWTPRQGAACDDGNACTSGDTCNKSVCEGGPPATCPDNNPCTVDACDIETGVCSNSPTPNGATCDDGDACTLGETCQAGACTPAGALVCDDGDACTADGCDPNTGCVFEGGSAAGSACTCVVGRARELGCGRVFVWGDEHVTYESYGEPPRLFWRNTLSWLAQSGPCGVVRKTVAFFGTSVTPAMTDAAADVGLTVVSGGSLPPSEGVDILVNRVSWVDAAGAADTKTWVEEGGALMMLIVGLGGGSDTECDGPNTIVQPLGFSYNCGVDPPWGPVQLPAPHPILTGLTEESVPFVNGRWVGTFGGVQSAVVGQVPQGSCPEDP